MSIWIKREGLPAALAEVYVDFYWSQQKLWNLDVKVSEIEISQLVWILDFPIWYLDPNPVPNTILKDPASDCSHWQRVLNADLDYPVHVLKWKGRLLILDGIHRLLRTKKEGNPMIRAKIIEKKDIEKILPSVVELNHGFLKRALGDQARKFLEN